MPELPEVETIRSQLEGPLSGRRITGAWAFDSPKFTDATAAIGSVVSGVARRGKYLLIGLEPAGTDSGAGAAELVVHLGMTGRLAFVSAGAADASAPHPHLRARWELDGDDVLTFHDARRFGRVAVVTPGRYEDLPTLHRLGPEPLSEQFTPDVLRSGLSGRRALKTVLLSQRVVAGVGNIYADEALWLAGVSPLARRLGTERSERLHAAIVEVLTEGLADGGTTLRDYRDAAGGQGTHQDRLACYGRAGQACRRCGTTLVGREVDARSTTWCPACQR